MVEKNLHNIMKEMPLSLPSNQLFKDDDKKKKISSVNNCFETYEDIEDIVPLSHIMSYVSNMKMA
jgi:hypothetical protein